MSVQAQERHSGHLLNSAACAFQEQALLNSAACAFQEQALLNSPACAFQEQALQRDPDLSHTFGKRIWHQTAAALCSSKVLSPLGAQSEEQP